jgi:2,4-dienoyl-CoA reductase (NADPH2)
MVSLARPMLADANFVKKAMEDRSNEINTCIGCNQACLDHVFVGKVASCLVNPRACHETELTYTNTMHSKNIAIVGAGPAGLACAVTAAKRGHKVTLYDKDSAIGGQFNIAKQIPGKEEFYETLRYYQTKIDKYGITLKLNHEVTTEELITYDFDEIVISTGITPRALKLEGINHPKVLSYIDVVKHKKPVGEKVAIIGAGGIGFDVAEYLLHDKSKPFDAHTFMQEWGIDDTLSMRGGILSHEVVTHTTREIYLCQRTPGKLGKKLGKTTGWIHRTSLKKHKVKMLSNLSYNKIDDNGLHYTQDGKNHVLEVDNIIICAGQESYNSLAVELAQKNVKSYLIGGAYEARELDAKFAINQGTRLAARL